MTNYRDKAVSKQKFLDIARSKPSLEGVDQLLDAVGTHLSLVAEAAFYEMDRNYQDSFLSTAITRPSVLALSYDRNYVPRKAIPSSGSIRVVNNNDDIRSIPSGLKLLSPDQLIYETTMPILVEANSNVLVNAIQIERQTITTQIDAETPFYEIKLDAETSRRISSITVSINGDEWVKTQLFRNTNEFSAVWSEFYTELDELGIRFGNGTYGKIPDIGSNVVIDLILTDGETLITSSQPLSVMDNDHVNDISFYSGTVIDAGNDMEGTEETRKNASYYFQYDEKHEWSNDYRFYLKQNFPDLLFCQVW